MYDYFIILARLIIHLFILINLVNRYKTKFNIMFMKSEHNQLKQQVKMSKEKQRFLSEVMLNLLKEENENERDTNEKGVISDE